MTLTMTQDCYNTKNEINASKGEKIELISDRSFPVLLVSNSRGSTFSVRESGTNYQEIKKDLEKSK